MQPEYEFLTEKKAMWAEMLEEVLRDWQQRCLPEKQAVKKC